MRNLVITALTAMLCTAAFTIYDNRHDEAQGRYAGAEAAKKQIFKIYEMECSANASSERLRSEDYCNGLRDSWFNIHSYAIMDKRNQEVRVYFPPEPSAH